MGRKLWTSALERKPKRCVVLGFTGHPETILAPTLRTLPLGQKTWLPRKGAEFAPRGPGALSAASLSCRSAQGSVWPHPSRSDPQTS